MDLLIFKHTFIDTLIDKAIWASITTIVISYIMPHFGLSAGYGLFQFGSILATIGLFELFATTFRFVADLEGDQLIGYTLTLPIPSYLAVVSKVIGYSISFFIIALCMLPIGKLCLWNQLSLWNISYFKLILILLLQNIFYAWAIIWISTIVKHTYRIGMVWSRFIFPLWFLGGFQFSWKVLYGINPIIALIDLLNPIIYITESTRTALIGQEGFINFWICFGVLTLFTALVTWHALHRLKQHLDYV